MSRVFIDTNFYIYLLEAHPEYGGVARSVYALLQLREDAIFTSWMTVAELQVKPRREGDERRCSLYRDTVQASATLIAFNDLAATSYTNIRSSKRAKAPDAIQLACAASVRSDQFLTNDADLLRLVVPGIGKILSLPDAASLLRV